MNYHLEPQYIQKSLNVLAKFGYLRKEFFWIYLSPNSRSSKFKNWKALLNTGYLASYSRSFVGDNVYKLSKRGKRVLTNAGIQPVSAAHPLHFEHDDNVIQFALANEKVGLIANFISEKELRRASATDLTLLFGNSLEKFPDLIFEIKSGKKTVRVAFEIERTRKSQSRYESLVRSYSKLSGIDLVIVAYCSNSVLQLVTKALGRMQYPNDLRPIAFCKIADLHKSWTEFPILIDGVSISFKKYIENLRKLDSEEYAMDFRSDGQSLFFTESACP